MADQPNPPWTEENDTATDTQSPAAPPVLLARQPILNRKLELFGYELLYRDSHINRAIFSDGDQATARVLVHAFLELGFEATSSGRPIFVNMTPALLQSELVRLLPPARTMLEVLETIHPNEAILDALRRLRGEGYEIVLDDFDPDSGRDALLEIASVVKLDVHGKPEGRLEQDVRKLDGRRKRLVAEKIESHAEFELCKGLGFELFQGYFLSKPELLRGRRTLHGRLGLLRLLGAVHDPDADLQGLEKIVQADVGLSYKLLRYINSAAFSLSAQINSVGHALNLMGIEPVRSWVSLLVLAGLDEKPRELLSLALIRAKTCELLGAALGHGAPSSCFTAGLFSALDALLDCPIEDALAKLPLISEVNEAIAQRKGLMGSFVAAALALERGDWASLESSEVPTSKLRQVYSASVRWADLMRGVLL